jgi:hypothetical protein
MGAAAVLASPRDRHKGPGVGAGVGVGAIEGGVAEPLAAPGSSAGFGPGTGFGVLLGVVSPPKKFPRASDADASYHATDQSAGDASSLGGYRLTNPEAYLRA